MGWVGKVVLCPSAYFVKKKTYFGVLCVYNTETKSTYLYRS